MDFFGIGLGEVVLILVLALIIWGPKRLPGIARTLGKTTRTLRKATSDFTSQITREMDIEEKERREKEKLPPPGQGRTTGKDTPKDE
jgi:sec-independent protein translocase protein TatA